MDIRFTRIFLLLLFLLCFCPLTLAGEANVTMTKTVPCKMGRVYSTRCFSDYNIILGCANSCICTSGSIAGVSLKKSWSLTADDYKKQGVMNINTLLASGVPAGVSFFYVPLVQESALMKVNYKDGSIMTPKLVYQCPAGYSVCPVTANVVSSRGGMLFLGIGNGAASTDTSLIVAVNSSTEELVWQQNTGEISRLLLSDTTDDGHLNVLYVVYQNASIMGVKALNAVTGVTIWDLVIMNDVSNYNCHPMMELNSQIGRLALIPACAPKDGSKYLEKIVLVNLDGSSSDSKEVVEASATADQRSPPIFTDISDVLLFTIESRLYVYQATPNLKHLLTYTNPADEKTDLVFGFIGTPAINHERIYLTTPIDVQKLEPGPDWSSITRNWIEDKATIYFHTSAKPPMNFLCTDSLLNEVPTTASREAFVFGNDIVILGIDGIVPSGLMWWEWVLIAGVAALLVLGGIVATYSYLKKKKRIVHISDFDAIEPDRSSAAYKPL